MTTTHDQSSTSGESAVADAASTAADEGKHVAGVAGEEASKVAGEAASQAKDLLSQSLDQSRSQLNDQAETQRDHLVEVLRTLSEDLQKMAGSDGGGGLAGDVVSRVADRAHGLTEHLDGREPSDLLGDVRDFAEARPGTFLLGALVAGVVAGRFARGAKAATSDASDAADDSRSATPVTAPSPVAAQSEFSPPMSAPLFSSEGVDDHRS